MAGLSLRCWQHWEASHLCFLFPLKVDWLGAMVMVLPLSQIVRDRLFGLSKQRALRLGQLLVLTERSLDLTPDCFVVSTEVHGSLTVVGVLATVTGSESGECACCWLSMSYVVEIYMFVDKDQHTRKSELVAPCYLLY